MLESVLAGLEGELGPRRGEPVSLGGGITNRNLRVRSGDHDAVVRLPGKETGHDDLLPANFIHDGTRVRILDREYAGMGDRYFDLGNLSVNMQAAFEDPRVERWLQDARG